MLSLLMLSLLLVPTPAPRTGARATGTARTGVQSSKSLLFHLFLIFCLFQKNCLIHGGSAKIPSAIYCRDRTFCLVDFNFLT